MTNFLEKLKPLLKHPHPPAFLLLVLLILLPATIYIINRVTTNTRVISASTATVTLSLSANPTTVTPGSTFSITITVDPTAGNHSVSAVTLELTYPSNLVTLNSTTPGPFFDQSLSNTQSLKIIDSTTPGRAKITLGAPCSSLTPVPTGPPGPCYTNNTINTLATLNFTANTTASGPATIAFDTPTVAIAALTQTTNVVDTTQLNPVSVNIQSSSTPLLSDSFGTIASSTIPNWSEQNPAEVTILTNDSEATGATGGYLRIGNGGWVKRAINATGYSNLKLSYVWRGDSQAESSDSGYIDYCLGATCTSFTTLKTHPLNSSSWSTLQTINLPTSVNNTTFTLRFRTTASASDEHFRIDTVTVGL